MHHLQLKHRFYQVSNELDDHYDPLQQQPLIDIRQHVVQTLNLLLLSSPERNQILHVMHAHRDNALAMA
ncbi:Uncharacterised protein [Actinobacillus pleuropneumoniae]|nr:Uncharacterised protein [Actinobacillus pleuropneumoniae]